MLSKKTPKLHKEQKQGDDLFPSKPPPYRCISLRRTAAMASLSSVFDIDKEKERKALPFRPERAPDRKTNTEKETLWAGRLLL